MRFDTSLLPSFETGAPRPPQDEGWNAGLRRYALLVAVKE